MGKVFQQFKSYSNQTSGGDLKKLSFAKLRKELKKPSLQGMAFLILSAIKKTIS